jgi:serine/threonine protein kinase
MKTVDALHLKTNLHVAIKIIDRLTVRVDEGKLLRELELVKDFRHPHVMKVYESFSVGSNLYVVMEYISGGDLFEILCRRGKVRSSSRGSTKSPKLANSFSSSLPASIIATEKGSLIETSSLKTSCSTSRDI